MVDVAVRAAGQEDAAGWLELRCELWPDGTEAEHREEIRQYFAGEFPRGPWVVFVAVDDTGAMLGFAEVSTRPYAEGCATTPVAYLEGWFAGGGHRRLGVGRALIAAAEAWGREQGCREFASDCAVDNDVSFRAHLGVGFDDAGLVRCFRKSL